MPEPDVCEPLEDPVGCGCRGVARGEELLGLGDGHGEHLADVTPTESVLEHRTVDDRTVPPTPGNAETPGIAALSVAHQGFVLCTPNGI